MTSEVLYSNNKTRHFFWNFSRDVTIHSTHDAIQLKILISQYNFPKKNLNKMRFKKF